MDRRGSSLGRSARSTMEANSTRGKGRVKREGGKIEFDAFEWSRRLVRSNGTLREREEEDRQDNYVNYRSIFNRRSGY